MRGVMTKHAPCQAGMRIGAVNSLGRGSSPRGRWALGESAVNPCKLHHNRSMGLLINKNWR